MEKTCNIMWIGSSCIQSLFCFLINPNKLMLVICMSSREGLSDILLSFLLVPWELWGKGIYPFINYHTVIPLKRRCDNTRSHCVPLQSTYTLSRLMSWRKVIIFILMIPPNSKYNPPFFFQMKQQLKNKKTKEN